MVNHHNKDSDSLLNKGLANLHLKDLANHHNKVLDNLLNKDLVNLHNKDLGNLLNRDLANNHNKDLGNLHNRDLDNQHPHLSKPLDNCHHQVLHNNLHQIKDLVNLYHPLIKDLANPNNLDMDKHLKDSNNQDKFQTDHVNFFIISI